MSCKVSRLHNVKATLPYLFINRDRRIDDLVKLLREIYPIGFYNINICPHIDLYFNLSSYVCLIMPRDFLVDFYLVWPELL